ncbi:hypothetical protein FKW77_001100 [Venturia effusa]|uniref:Mitochondrial import inner membrane translocase subunit TIM50 n=1 Tax=Venturia effusa TaxID=50376 RepID=A0A517LM75_9PEZI|nr:hypothetical protein FKW77_001100 [Venturia effusa]
MKAVPQPSQQYLAASNVTALRFDIKLPLLVILDLNGCLVVRKGAGIEPRENVKQFLHYLLHEHWVMVWSSAMSSNVQRILNTLLTKEEQAKLVAVWDRSHFDLTKEQYDSKIQLYKELSRVWESDYIQAKHPYAAIHPWAYWNFYNTVLIDDTHEKAKSEPFNHLHIPQLLPLKEVSLQPGTTVLGQVAEYLDALRHSGNVANSIKNEPFKLNDHYNLDWKASGGIETENVEAGNENMEDRPPNED